MTKDELWKIYCEKNPQFAEESAEVTLTVRGLKKLFDQAFDQGAKFGSRGSDFFDKMMGYGKGPFGS